MQPTKEDFREHAMRKSEEIKEEAMEAFRYAVSNDDALAGIHFKMHRAMAYSAYTLVGGEFVYPPDVVEHVRLLGELSESRRQEIADAYGVKILRDGRVNFKSK